MAGFIYFLPGQSGGVGPKVAEAFKLIERLPRGYSVLPVSFPEASDGLLCFDPAAVPVGKACINLSEQEWVSEQAGELVMLVGAWRGEMPGESDLRRAVVTQKNSAVYLGNGEAWLIPLLRMHDGTPMLPTYLALDAERKPVTRVARGYERLDKFGEAVLREWEIFRDLRREGLTIGSQKHYEEYLKRTGGGIDLADRIERCEEALAVNYALGRAEIELLQLLNARTIHHVHAAFLGEYENIVISEVLEWEKKIRDSNGLHAELAALVKRFASWLSSNDGGVGVDAAVAAVGAGAVGGAGDD